MFKNEKLDTIAKSLAEIKALLEKDIIARERSFLLKDVSKISDAVKTIQIDVDTLKQAVAFQAKK